MIVVATKMDIVNEDKLKKLCATQAQEAGTVPDFSRDRRRHRRTKVGPGEKLSAISHQLTAMPQVQSD